MKRTEFASWPCSIARSVDLLGDWWTPLVLREVFLGVRRFDDMQRSLGIGRNVLTEKGRDFYPVLAAMITWGDRWLAGDEGPPIVLRHTACGHDMTARVVCSECGDPIRAKEVRARIGPGYPADQPPPGRIRPAPATG